MVAESRRAGTRRSRVRTWVSNGHGRGVRQDETEAARGDRRAAEQGHGDAQVNLGLLYQAVSESGRIT